MGEILDLMEQERVLLIYYGLQGNEDKFTLFEGCDSNFAVDLTADQMRQLGQEIIDMADEADGER